ncbi:hypothetical protein RhiirC2_871356 [Rhizophagus irregularis]|uniref:Uncharacterized protein n=1 Tax=Rhizophagus irregularis TaxID=588596 RepID=A0A2N1MC14_9GLOM|nr:hypothetical protein RhiirC2_871356 [Rhizophagus irregularis]
MSTKNTKKKTGKNAKKKTKVFHNSPEKKDEASQKTGNILSQILSADDVSSQDTENVDDNASVSTSYTETRISPDYDNILTSPHTEGPFVLVVPDKILKSSTSNNPTKSIKSGKPKKIGRAYKKVSKELIPKILFPSDMEYREEDPGYLV